MFAHIFFLYHPEINKGGLFGYEYWSVFFASLMYPVLFFVFGYLLQRINRAFINDLKGKKLTNVLIGTLYFFSLFYLIITFFPYKNSFNRIGLSPFWYYIASSVCGISVVLIIMFLPEKIMINSSKKLKNKIRILINFIVSTRKKVKDVDAYDVEVFDVLEVVADD